MPEAPEVRRVADKLRTRLKDKSLLFIDWLSGTKYSPVFDQTWPYIDKLFPTTCLEIICRGKQLFFFLENGLALISGLGMEGHWYYFKSNFEEREALNKYVTSTNYPKFCLHFGTQTEVNGVSWHISDTEIWYDDMLSYGNFAIINWADASAKMKKIGPDLLATTQPFADIHPSIQRILPSEFFQPATIQNFTSSIRAPRRSQMLLCVFLLTHQEYFSGIGNWIKSEVLYRARLHPNRVLGSLTDQEIQLLFYTCLNVISQGYQCGGLTHGTFLDPDMQKGSFPVLVYKRENQYDPHGFQIKKIATNDGRSTYVVDEVQV